MFTKITREKSEGIVMKKCIYKIVRLSFLAERVSNMRNVGISTRNINMVE